MDRFIDITLIVILKILNHLKSNMDRFIELFGVYNMTGFALFKIQYGQIYSYGVPHNLKAKKYLKSNMDRFIVFNV